MINADNCVKAVVYNGKTMTWYSGTAYSDLLMLPGHRKMFCAGAEPDDRFYGEASWSGSNADTKLLMRRIWTLAQLLLALIRT